jgi:hypothetical protein
MATTWAGRLRCRMFLPDRSEVTFERRGFYAPDAARQQNLEKVGLKFLLGFEYGMGGRYLTEVESSLETIEPAFRGFGYEGCSMALAIRDAMSPVGGRWVRALLASRGAAHVYMAYIGVGWAMARLPRPRWRAIAPRDPLLRWLALDGYGFHQAYFRTSQYLTGQYQAPIHGWRSPYANRAVDQGIGRALWFANGADVAHVAELMDMVQRAGEYRPHAAQGAAFAGEARLRADLVTPGTELGVKIHCGMSVEDAAAVTLETREGLPEADGPVPSYELWRERIRQRFA